MYKQEKLTELNEVINASRIIVAIESLKNQLNNYQQALHMKDHRYTIQFEFDALTKELNAIKYQLADLIERSREWEKHE